MIGEGIQSTNQRKHSYVHDHVEVGFFTDPSVCIGCKACEVACKEWNQVPDDGFTWSGNSYDNTGHLGASTWRHVMFLEQDRQKGNQITGPMGLPIPHFKIRNRKIRSAGFFCPMFASTAKKLVVLRRVRPDRSFALKLARCWCRTMSATAAAIALSRVRSG
jgi:hypothetical protein